MLHLLLLREKRDAQITLMTRLLLVNIYNLNNIFIVIMEILFIAPTQKLKQHISKLLAKEFKINEQRQKIFTSEARVERERERLEELQEKYSTL